MLNSVDLYLGSFLILCGFTISLINLKSLIREKNLSFSLVLISENVLLMCIGIAFISRAINNLNPDSVQMYEIEERTANIPNHEAPMSCNFQTVLLSYGPLIISLVNSFLCLVIDNYMHYSLLAASKNKREEEDTVQSISQQDTTEARANINKVLSFLKKYVTILLICLQWTVPILLTMGMYPIDIKEIVSRNIRNLDESCVNILDMTTDNCSLTNYTEYTLELRNNYIPAKNYLIAYENEPFNENKSKQIDSVIEKVYKIMSNLNNDSIQDKNGTSTYMHRKSKTNEYCMKVCYLNNKHMILYIFMLTITSIFIPVTVSTIILTKIHMMNIKKSNMKAHVNKELLYNIIFWSPVMFDTFLSLLLCSYSTTGMRASIFNIIANVYQAVKNFINTKYFHNSSIVPV